jgi:hypothetical protein
MPFRAYFSSFIKMAFSFFLELFASSLEKYISLQIKTGKSRKRFFPGFPRQHKPVFPNT